MPHPGEEAGHRTPHGMRAMTTPREGAYRSPRDRRFLDSPITIATATTMAAPKLRATRIGDSGPGPSDRGP